MNNVNPLFDANLKKTCSKRQCNVVQSWCVGSCCFFFLCVKVTTFKMGVFSCPALKSALLHSPATRDKAAQVAEVLSKPEPAKCSRWNSVGLSFKSGSCSIYAAIFSSQAGSG